MFWYATIKTVVTEAKLDKLPLTHNLAFLYSWYGFKGSSYVWKAAKKIQKTPECKVRLPNRIVVSHSENDWTARTIYEGTYERELMKFLMNLDLHEEIYVDIGANIGSTIQAVMGSNSEIAGYAFEPSEICLSLLKENLSEYNHVSIQECAVSDKNGRIEFFDYDNKEHTGLANSRLMATNKTQTKFVPCVSLDNVFEATNLNFIVKIDTEGHEPRVVSGMKNLIAREAISMVIMEYTPQWMNPDFVLNLNSQIWGREGCDLYVIESKGWFRVRPRLSPISPEALGKIEKQVNIVLSRNLSRFSSIKGSRRNV